MCGKPFCPGAPFTYANRRFCRFNFHDITWQPIAAKTAEQWIVGMALTARRQTMQIEWLGVLIMLMRWELRILSNRIAFNCSHLSFDRHITTEEPGSEYNAQASRMFAKAYDDLHAHNCGFSRVAATDDWLSELHEINTGPTTGDDSTIFSTDAHGLANSHDLRYVNMLRLCHSIIKLLICIIWTCVLFSLHLIMINSIDIRRSRNMCATHNVHRAHIKWAENTIRT